MKFIMVKSLICVIFGGKSKEYEVSLASAYSVLEAIDKEKYEIVKIGITKKGKWYIFEGENESILNDSWQDKTKELLLDINDGAFIVDERKLKPDKILPILHGEYGEDGRIQSLFEVCGIDYCGCDSFCSFICMDKNLTKMIAKNSGVKVANGFTAYKRDDYNSLKGRVTKTGYPVVVKPSNGGSSVGVSVVKNECELRGALIKAFSVCDTVLIEEKINGKEVEIAVIEKDGEMYFSTVGELRYDSEFYDYDEY